MSVLASSRKCLDTDRKFSKVLFTEVSNDLKVFSDEEWESVKETLEYKKILIAVYIRTNIDNLVLLIDEDNKIASISNVPTFVSDSGIYPNILVDSGLICAKNLIESVFSFKNTEAMQRLVMNSVCYPVGAVETSKKYVLVFNVVLSNTLLVDSDISLKQGFHFHPIETLCLTDSLQKEISESLIIVKSEDNKK